MNTSQQRRGARKTPKQARSKVTVEAILDGAIRVFDREKSGSVTTSQIAEAAGVSVGTLYQYFGDRDDIIDALQEREFERAGSMLADKLSPTAFSSPRDLAHAIVAGLLELYRAAPGLHRLLAIDGLRVAPTERVQAFDHRLVEMLRSFLEMTSFAIKRKNRHAAAFVLYHSVRATMLAAIMEEPLGLSDESLVGEVTDMVLSHLLRDS